MTLVSAQTATKQTIGQLIDTTLSDFFNASIKKAKLIDPYYESLWQNLANLQASGGKRIRPKIVLMAYDAFGGTDFEAVIPIACAQELLHFSMLIHDDVIDRDTTRYGVDNINGMYQKIYSPHVIGTTDRDHYANSAAIMAGDLMIAAAHRLINNSTMPDAKKILAHNLMYDSIFDVVGGELLDTESSFRPAGSIDPLKIAHYKTASYSFVGPFLTGANLAGASEKDQATVRDMAIHLGIAYQLTDDLLGVFGDEAKTGKSSTGDIREGKQTFLIDCTTKRLTTDQLLTFQKYFGKPHASREDVEKVKNLINTSGARKQVEKAIDDYVRQSRQSLDRLSIPQSAHQQITELIDAATKRDF